MKYVVCFYLERLCFLYLLGVVDDRFIEVFVIELDRIYKILGGNSLVEKLEIYLVGELFLGRCIFLVYL